MKNILKYWGNPLECNLREIRNMHNFISLIQQILLAIYNVSDVFVGAGGMSENKTEKTKKTKRKPLPL